jgi:hypothetical protein
MKIDWMNLVERAAWTFVEAFLVALPTTISMDMNGAAWKSALLGAACAGVSALKTFIIDVIKSMKGEINDV